MFFQINTVILFSLVGALSCLVNAQTPGTPTGTSPSSSSTSCAAQTILDACISQYKPQIEACAGNNWDCLCQQWTNLATCYNNCPSDPSRPSVQQSVSQYCTAASAYGSSSSSSSSSSSNSAATTSSTSTSTSTTNPTSPTTTKTTSKTSSETESSTSSSTSSLNVSPSANAVSEGAAVAVGRMKVGLGVGAEAGSGAKAGLFGLFALVSLLFF